MRLFRNGDEEGDGA